MGLLFGCESEGVGLLAAERCNYCIFICFVEEIPARIEALIKTRAGCQSLDWFCVARAPSPASALAGEGARPTR
jgi:hypothetical protein